MDIVVKLREGFYSREEKLAVFKKVGLKKVTEPWLTLFTGQTENRLKLAKKEGVLHRLKPIHISAAYSEERFKSEIVPLLKLFEEHSVDSIPDLKNALLEKAGLGHLKDDSLTVRILSFTKRLKALKERNMVEMAYKGLFSAKLSSKGFDARLEKLSSKSPK